jgi:hypothetical protein
VVGERKALRSKSIAEGEVMAVRTVDVLLDTNYSEI